MGSCSQVLVSVPLAITTAEKYGHRRNASSMNTPAATRNFLLSAVLGVSGRWHGAWAMPSEMPPMRSCRACGLCVRGQSHRKSSARVLTCRHHNESGWQPSDKKGGDDATDLLPTVSVRLHPHDRSAGPRPQPAPAGGGGRADSLRFSSLASQQGRVSRGALPVAGQRQRPAAPRRRRTPALTRSRSALPGCH